MSWNLQKNLLGCGGRNEIFLCLNIRIPSPKWTEVLSEKGLGRRVLYIVSVVDK